MEKRFQEFFQSEAYGVVGASNDRSKYGNKVLRCYLQHHKTVYPVHPQEKEIEGLSVIPNVSKLPDEVKSISIITPPRVTEQIVDQAIARGIQNIWMQPGAESDLAIEKCRKAKINAIADGSCLLVILGFHDKKDS